MFEMEGTFDRFRLRGTMDEVLRQVSSESQRDVPWKIINMLPSTLILYVEKYLSGKPELLSKIEPHQVLTFPPHRFGNRDQLFVYYNYRGRLIPFLQPYMFRDIWRTIRLGAVEYSSEGGHLQVQASNWDMRGIWLHNKLAVPINVYYKGNLVAQMSGYDGMTYLGGSASSVYFSNALEGLDFDDSLEFRYSLPGDKDKYMFSVKIDDEQCLSMYIGTISGGMWGPDPDNAIYRVDKPVYTGITFYRPVGRYDSIATNPLAPF